MWDRVVVRVSSVRSGGGAGGGVFGEEGGGGGGWKGRVFIFGGGWVRMRACSRVDCGGLWVLDIVAGVCEILVTDGPGKCCSRLKMWCLGA